MSDGDNAAPGRRRPRDPADDNQWLTRTSRRAPAAAPWERSDPLNRAQPVVPDDVDEVAGSHTGGGVTVADLIAKVAEDGTGPPEVTRRHRPEPEPPAPPTEIIEAVTDDADAYE